MIKHFILVVILLASTTSFAQETFFDIGAGVNQPYVFDPSNGIGDTTLNISMDARLYKMLWVHSGFNYGIMGVHATRLEVGPELRFLGERRISPFFNTGPVFQFSPFTNTGIYFHTGVIGDLSRVVNIQFIKLKLETGLDFFLTNVERSEWEIIRISLVYGF